MIVFIELFGPALFFSCTAYLLARFTFKRPRGLDFHLSFAILLIALITIATAGVGFYGKLNSSTLLLISVVTFLGIVVAMINPVMSAKGLWQPVMEKEEPFDFFSAMLIILAVLFGAGLAAGISRPPIEHDVMTYHLFFPARWIQEWRIFPVPTVFGDIAPTYAPSNAELLFSFLSLPFHSDTLSRIGQFPYLLIGSMSIFLLARKFGASTTGALIPVLAVATSPILFRQGFSAEVDLALSATFMSALYFLECYRRQPSHSNAALLGIAVGLCIGTKFIGLTFCVLIGLPFLVFLIRNLKRQPAYSLIHLLAVPVLILVTGGFWYIRNWILTGNPLFPLDLPPFFQGIYNKAAMEKSIFHIPSAGFIFPVLISAYGLWHFLLALASFGLGIYLAFRKKLHGFALFYLLLPFALFAIHFLMIPYNSQYRFLLVAVMATFLPLAALEPSPLVKKHLSKLWLLPILFSLFYFGPAVRMAGFALPTKGLIPLAYVPALTFAALCSTGVWFGLRKLKIEPKGRLFLTLIATFLVVNYLTPLFFHGQTKQLVEVRPNLSSEYPIQAWSFFNGIAEPTVIAYSGTNVPYYLMGRDWRHRAVYVNVNARQTDIFHDFLDFSSDSKFHRPSTTDKPAYLWRIANKKFWKRNLLIAGAEYLFVNKLSPDDRIYDLQDKEHFPVERHWANQEPELFESLMETPVFRIYKIKTSPLMQQVMKEFPGNK